MCKTKTNMFKVNIKEATALRETCLLGESNRFIST